MIENIKDYILCCVVLLGVAAFFLLLAFLTSLINPYFWDC